MKLNEFKETKQLDELGLNQVIGDYGAAAAKQIGNRLLGKGEGQLSIKDKMAKQNFIDDFIGRASTNLDSGIRGGQIDPNPNSGTVKPPVDTTKPAPTPPVDTTKPAPTPPVNTTKPAPTVATPKTPEQIRIEKQKAAAANAQKQMAPFSKLPKSSVAPAAPAAPSAPTVPGVKQPRAGAKSRAMLSRRAFNKGTKVPSVAENTYNKLNSIFESILTDAETQYIDTISTYLQKMFRQYMKGVNLSDPKVQSQIKSLSDEAMNTYSKDKGKAALTKLANLGFSLNYSHAGGEVGQASDEPQTVGQALMKGAKQGLGIDTAVSTPTSTTAPATTKPETSPAAVAKKEQSVYMQVKSMLDKLDKKGKQRILAALQKQLGATTPSVTTEPSAGSSAMTNMARQLDVPKTTSTGGTATPTGRGVRHTASATNPNMAPKIDARAKKLSKRTPAKKKVASPLPTVAETKQYKLWGQR